MINKIRQLFEEKFKNIPLIVSAPGRVNLIGEHLDYNNGYVLPGAIDKRIVVAIHPNTTGMINVFAVEYNETFGFDPANIVKGTGWQNYILGVTHFVQQHTQTLASGLDIIIDGNVPVGGGMSSSAALCSAYGFALNTLFGLGLSLVDLALIGQQTEHHFAGVKCGIMDQFTSLHGKAGKLIRLDCRSLEYEYIPFDFPDHRIVLVNTMVSHSLAASEYNVRRHQCEEGVEILKKYIPSIQSLRDVQLTELFKHREEMPEKVFLRCKYVVEEIQRLLSGCDHLRNGDLKAFGKLMYRTHESLCNEYEVSCPELDFLVDLSRSLPGVEGSRMMGGGFGGCTINIVGRTEVEPFASACREAFEKRFGKDPEVYITRIEDGTKVVESKAMV